LQLPELRERDLFLGEPGLSLFLDAIQQHPSEDRSYTLPNYSVSLQYVADADGPTVLSTAPRFDAPQTLREHGLYRLLVEKADQHRVTDLPLVICVGSDASPLLTSFPGPNQPETRRVVNEFFGVKPWVSASLQQGFQLPIFNANIVVWEGGHAFWRGETDLQTVLSTLLGK
jgi:hypothetical protein